MWLNSDQWNMTSDLLMWLHFWKETHKISICLLLYDIWNHGYYPVTVTSASLCILLVPWEWEAERQSEPENLMILSQCWSHPTSGLLLCGKIKFSYCLSQLTRGFFYSSQRYPVTQGFCGIRALAQVAHELLFGLQWGEHYFYCLLTNLCWFAARSWICFSLCGPGKS